MQQSNSLESVASTRCTYCGNNPVNHRYRYFSQTLSVLVSTWELPMPLNEAVRARIEKKMMRLIFALLKLVGILRYTEAVRPVSDRSLVVYEEGKRRGHTIEQVFFCGKPTEDYRILHTGIWHHYTSLPLSDGENTALKALVDSKAYLKNLFLQHGVRVPHGGRATSVEEATQIFERIEKPVIVKPEIGSRGRHTITHIKTKEELREAFQIAQELCRFVVVEEHLSGSVYRATCVDGNVVGVLRGDPPRVTGDGASSINELITRKNATKHARQRDFVRTKSSLAFLNRQGYSLDTVLPSAVTIDLTEKIGLSYGGFAVEEFRRTHPKLLALLSQASSVLGLPIVGFDVISEDITQDPDRVRWGIIEANTLPFIDLHHFPVEGDPVNVAASVWALWEKSN